MSYENLFEKFALSSYLELSLKQDGKSLKLKKSTASAVRKIEDYEAGKSVSDKPCRADIPSDLSTHTGDQTNSSHTQAEAISLAHANHQTYASASPSTSHVLDGVSNNKLVSALLAAKNISDNVLDKRFVRAARVGFFKTAVQEGELLKSGQIFGYIGAVNINHEQKIVHEGRVRAVLVADGEGVAYGDPILEME